MKKVFSILAALAVFSLSVTAQSTFTKGNKIVEGTVSYSDTTGKASTFLVAPSIGYMVTDKVAVGVTGEFTKNVTNFGAYGRCYFLNIGKSLKVFSQLNVGRSSDRFATDLGLGANYFVTEKLALSASLANLASYNTGDGVSNFSVGFTGVNNPLSATKFGVLYKF